jgi:hypothetical protein
MTKKNNLGVGAPGQIFADRKILVAYLEYAVDDVATVNETSATFLRMAISHLEHSSSLLPPFDGIPKLS